MAAISVTESEVVASTTATVVHLVAGAVIAAGKTVYKAADGLAYLADCDASVATASLLGICVGGATAIGQYCSVQIDGTVTIGASASLTAGMTIWLSPTAGSMTATAADILTADYLVRIGVANASHQIVMSRWYSGIAHA